MLRIDRQSAIAKSAHVPQKRKRRRRLATAQHRRASTSSSSQEQPLSSDEAAAAATDHQIRAENAYPGASNSIGSIHQRRWFISLDRVGSGFTRQSPRTGTRKNNVWTRKRDPEHKGSTTLLGFEPFHVRGPEVEKSVVTMRRAQDVLDDEGVKEFVRRPGWRAVI